ncbi:hypothetical protein D8674_011770 [Pyrus ussuriensis x Pyrus communis]|uniref:Uncharacterized protein n=1 Tax=Pyrus ussuriensis x Pyrus communis TaxID=2448454 RepID=A0A5N5G598_9ROSA|nr:hypothetical protein D8674_011770 [Pyrus ussuriensis x Pyrus communis]
MASPLPRLRVGQSKNSLIKALAMELNYPPDTGVDRKPGLWPRKNRVDNPSPHNPLLWQERMGMKQAWLVLSQEEGKSPPPTFMLRIIEGMKNEQIMSEVLCWSRDPVQLRTMAAGKEDIYQALQEFVNVLMHYKIPMALVSTHPQKTLKAAMGSIGIEEYFIVMAAAEDYAVQLLKFIPEWCIVFGKSNQTIEVAHDAKMKCVAVASKHLVYELVAADLVVRCLDKLSMVDLKNLVAIESEFGYGKLELEMEEHEDPSTLTKVAFDDNFR